jgi:predicted PurR-regulated permease PerM
MAMDIELSARQKKIAGVGVTTLAACVILAAVLTTMVLIVRFFSAFDHVFLPLAVAAVVALVIRPLHEWLMQKAGLPAGFALVATFLMIGVPLVGALALFGTLIVVQLTHLVEQLPYWYAQVSAWLESHRPTVARTLNEHMLGGELRETLQRPGGPFGGILEGALDMLLAAGSGVVSAVVSLFGWAITPVYIAFFLLMPRLDSKRVCTIMMPFLRQGTREDLTFLAGEFVELVVTFFRGQLLIALIQGVLFAIGFSLVGLEYGIVLGLTLGFLNIIPYLGSIIGLAVCLPLAWFQPEGGLELAAMVLLVFAVVQMIEGYLLTPKIMGERTGLHPLVIIVAIFFWGSALDGIIGMILAIPLTAFLVVAWHLARDKYIREIF